MNKRIKEENKSVSTLNYQLKQTKIQYTLINEE